MLKQKQSQTHWPTLNTVIMVEKTLKEMDKIVELANDAEKRDVKFHVFENFRHHPPYIKMKEILDSGVCGELKSVFYTMISSLFLLSLFLFKI